MTAEEFLLEQWNKCFCMVHDDYPENILMIYDAIHIRKLKLKSLNNSNDDIKFIKSDETMILFYQDYKYGYLDINYNDVWSVLSMKYKLKYDEIVELIITVLLKDNKLIPCDIITLEHNNSKQLTPTHIRQPRGKWFLDNNELDKLTPIKQNINTKKYYDLLDNKLNKLKPIRSTLMNNKELLEDNKLKNI